jgi:hypothetical protein
MNIGDMLSDLNRSRCLTCDLYIYNQWCYWDCIFDRYHKYNNIAY